MAVREMVLDLLKEIQHDIRFLDQIFSIIRKDHTPACPLHELASPLALDGLQPFCQGRLGHKEGVGGLCDAALFI